jgi:hypothetical protein
MLRDASGAGDYFELPSTQVIALWVLEIFVG